MNSNFTNTVVAGAVNAAAVVVCEGAEGAGDTVLSEVRVG